MYDEPLYWVIDRRTGERLNEDGSLPSGMLLQEGGGDAFLLPFSDGSGSLWRLREDTDPPGTEYRNVIIRRNPRG